MEDEEGKRVWQSGRNDKEVVGLGVGPPETRRRSLDVPTRGFNRSERHRGVNFNLKKEAPRVS